MSLLDILGLTFPNGILNPRNLNNSLQSSQYQQYLMNGIPQNPYLNQQQYPYWWDRNPYELGSPLWIRREWDNTFIKLMRTKSFDYSDHHFNQALKENDPAPNH